MRPHRDLRRMNHHAMQSAQSAGRFVGGVFGFVFFGIGLTVLISLWGAPFGAFGSPPLFFRVFGSFIALAFVAMGGTALLGAIRGAGPFSTDHVAGVQAMMDRATDHEPGSPTASQAGYHCPHCGAPLSEGVDISPHGDAKCGYCNCWFNIHGK